MSFQDNGFELIGADEDPAHGLAGSLSEPVEREGICPKGTVKYISLSFLSS